MFLLLASILRICVCSFQIPKLIFYFFQCTELFSSISTTLVTKFLFIYLKELCFFSVNLTFLKFILLTCIDILTYKIIELYKSYPIMKTQWRKLAFKGTL